jgi:hypothetical protein
MFLSFLVLSHPEYFEDTVGHEMSEKIILKHTAD